MKLDLKGTRLTVLGGDDRELVLIPSLLQLGIKVTVVGFPMRHELAGAYLEDDVARALAGAEAVVMPMPGTDANGVVRAVYAEKPLILRREDLALLHPGTPVIIGVARPFLRQWCAEAGLKLLEIAETDEVAILNAVPTAEGAIQIAIQETPITIHASQSYVLGFGRVGQIMARMLAGIGAHVSIAARQAKDLARAYTLGYRAYSFEELAHRISEADFIFNTVPAMVLDARVLQAANPLTLIIDLATQPGGTDFQAAARLGIKAILAPGLPGKVAPRTAGQVLGRTIPPLLQAYLGAE